MDILDKVEAQHNNLAPLKNRRKEREISHLLKLAIKEIPMTLQGRSVCCSIGHGLVLQTLQYRTGGNVTAVTFNESDHVETKKLNIALDHVLADYHHIPLDNHNFDYSCLVGVLRYGPSLHDFFTELFRIMKPGAQGIIIEPVSTGVKVPHAHVHRLIKRDCHTPYTLRTIEKHLKSCGFTIDRATLDVYHGKSIVIIHFEKFVGKHKHDKNLPDQNENREIKV